MSGDNPRFKVLNLIKLGSAAFIDMLENDCSEDDAAAACDVYMKEILDIPVETEKIQHIQQSGLKSENLLHLLERDENIKKTPSEEQIKALFSPDQDEGIDFTKDLELIYEESKSRSRSSESSSNGSQPLKKAKLDSPFSSQDNDPFEGGDNLFASSTQAAIENVNNFFLPKIQQEELPKKNAQFANPWRSKNVKTSNNPRVAEKAVPEASKVMTKNSLNENFKSAWGSNVAPPVKQAQPNSKPPPAFSNPWSMAKSSANLKNKIPPAVVEDKPLPIISIKQPEVEKKDPFSSYMTARQQLALQLENEKKSRPKGLTKSNCPSVISQRKQDRNEDPLRKKFTNPLKSANENKPSDGMNDDEELNHELLKGFDRNLLMRIKREVVSQTEKLSWDDIAGLDKAKQAIFESVIYPVRQPELYQGLRRGSRAILLFGSPGNGKTLIGKAISSEVDATFLSISASSLTSKWIGESENLVRAMFAYAVVMQPSVIFFDEIDSLLMKRDGSGEGGGESMIRLKTEFLVQLDGTNSLKDSDQVILIGATNRPDSIDEAVRRRFTKRILIPLPNNIARIQLMKNLLYKNNENHSLNEINFEELAELTEGFSGSDLNNLAKEASIRPLRKFLKKNPDNQSRESIPPTSIKDFKKALDHVKSSVEPKTLIMLDEWNKQFGSGAAEFYDDSDDSD